MIGKIHISDDRKKTFACCDISLIDKNIEFNGINIKISSSFYSDFKLTKDSLIKNIKDCDSANIFGKKVCNILLENNLIKKEQIIYIKDIPHIQIYNV